MDEETLLFVRPSVRSFVFLCPLCLSRASILRGERTAMLHGVTAEIVVDVAAARICMSVYPSVHGV